VILGGGTGCAAERVKVISLATVEAAQAPMSTCIIIDSDQGRVFGVVVAHRSSRRRARWQ
jgi:precorrin-3B methylase